MPGAAARATTSASWSRPADRSHPARARSSQRGWADAAYSVDSFAARRAHVASEPSSGLATTEGTGRRCEGSPHFPSGPSRDRRAGSLAQLCAPRPLARTVRSSDRPATACCRPSLPDIGVDCVLLDARRMGWRRAGHRQPGCWRVRYLPEVRDRGLREPVRPPLGPEGRLCEIADQHRHLRIVCLAPQHLAARRSWSRWPGERRTSRGLWAGPPPRRRREVGRS